MARRCLNVAGGGGVVSKAHKRRERRQYGNSASVKRGRNCHARPRLVG